MFLERVLRLAASQGEARATRRCRNHWGTSWVPTAAALAQSVESLDSLYRICRESVESVESVAVFGVYLVCVFF